MPYNFRQRISIDTHTPAIFETKV